MKKLDQLQNFFTKGITTSCQMLLRCPTTLLLLLLWILLSNTAFTQCPNCSNYQEFMQTGKSYFNKAQYGKALTEFQAAQVAARICDCNSSELAIYIKRAFKGIEQQKEAAIAAQKRAEAAENEAKKALEATQKAQAEAEKAKTEAQTNLAKASKLVNAFYFYGDRFALAYGRNNNTNYKEKFYFIDKDGDFEERLGVWDKAEQFDYTGYSKIKAGGTDYLLDTLGVKYKVAYKLEQLTQKMEALDLRGTALDSFPMSILAYPKLQVLILDGEYEKNNKIIIPTRISQLRQLKTLSLN